MVNLTKHISDIKESSSSFALNATLFVEQLSNFKLDIAITITKKKTETK